MAQSSIQSGTATIGPNSGGPILTKTIQFDAPFASPPIVVATPLGEPVPDVLAATVVGVTNSGFTVSVYRLGSITTWNQNLRINWVAAAL